MLYWYSGTGNSRKAAQILSQELEETDCRFIPSALGVDTEAGISLTSSASRKQDDLLGFCFPVYSWGVPPVVLKLITGLDADIFKDKYIYAVLTCGDEAGLAKEMLDKALKKRGACLNGAFTVIMPNDYVMLPGFNIDCPELQREKLAKAVARLRDVSQRILLRENVTDVFRGPMAWIKTKAVYPLFKKWGVQTSRWRVNHDLCISCGKCAGVCPSGNVSLKVTEGLEKASPIWSKRCYSCTACFHICPVRAIDYGGFTKGKKQYYLPLSANLNDE